MPDDERPFARRPTLVDVAAAAGVSRALVSIVIRGAPGASDRTRQRVMEIANDLGYHADSRARLLARSRTRLLGVVFHVQSAFHGDLLPGVYAAADNADYEVVLSGSTPGHDEGRAIKALLGFRCDALVLLGPETPEERLAEIASRLPVVVVGRRLTSHAADSVRTDDEAGMRLAVEHLVTLGHRDIAHVDGGSTVKSADRVRGYRTAMTSFGLAERISVIAGGETVEAGVAAAEGLLADRGSATAVAAYDDDCAWGLISTLEAGGVSVPGDLSVVGFDGSRLSRLAYDLTTVRQDADALASVAVDLAVARLDHLRPSDPDVVLPPSLIVRGSTAPVARAEDSVSQVRTPVV
jgi:DNA-binding LacI/PurR family transcriptional regulator